MHSITDFLAEFLSGKTGNLDLWQSFLAVLIAYLGGVLASLTPCVYPMIPITVSVVGGIGPQGRRAWHEMAIRSLVYVSGMTLVYSFLGVLAGVSGRVFGSFTNNATWYLCLGIVMSFAALMMLDVIAIDPLSTWETLKRKFFHLRKKGHAHAQNGSHQHKEMTLVGAFMLGASSGFIAAPCTTPVLTSILAYIAKTQSVGLGFVLMLAFSLGLGTLLLLVAAFAGAVQVLPRSGKWMKTVKVLSGIILLAFAEYLIYRAGNFGGTLNP